MLKFNGSWEWPNYPLYYFDSQDVPDKYLKPSKQRSADGEADLFDVVTNAKVAEGVAFRYTSGKRAGLTKIVSKAMDAWFEEDEEIFVHPKDPYKVGL